MNFERYFIFIVFVIFLAADSVLSTVNYPWMYYLPYGNTVTLKPLFKNRTEIESFDVCKWTTPNKIDLIADVYTYDIYRYRLDKQTCELTIFNIQKDTNGVYHCTVNEKYISKAMLNVHGAPKNSLYEEFRPNIIAGFTAAAG